MQNTADGQGEKCSKVQIFSERLKARRNRLGLSQIELAEKARASPRSIVAWEQGLNIPSGRKLTLLADALGESIPWLLGESVGYHVQTQEPARLIDAPMLKDDPYRPNTRIKIMEHIQEILAAIGDNEPRLNWVLCELQDRFPVAKFRPSRPINSDELTEDQRILKQVGDRYDAEHRHS